MFGKFFTHRVPENPAEQAASKAFHLWNFIIPTLSHIKVVQLLGLVLWSNLLEFFHTWIVEMEIVKKVALVRDWKTGSHVFLFAIVMTNYFSHMFAVCSFRNEFAHTQAHCKQAHVYRELFKPLNA